MSRKFLNAWMVTALVVGIILSLAGTLVLLGMVLSPNFHWSAFAFSQVATIFIGFFWISEFNRARKKLRRMNQKAG